MKKKKQPKSYREMQLWKQLYIWEITLFLQANRYRLKTKNINSLILINTIIK